jgi:hypothetical protein
MDADKAAALRAPFPPEQIGKLPKGGTSLDFVGHAAVTDRLLAVDPLWKWDPDRTGDGRWDVQQYGNDAVLTGTLTVCGVTRPCVGIAPAKSFELLKQLQSDAIRNGAMRFGVALDLWSREDLHAEPAEAPAPRKKAAAKKPAVQRSGVEMDAPPVGGDPIGDGLVPVASAKASLLATCGGDTELAKRLWGSMPDGPNVTAADLDALLDQAEAVMAEAGRPFEGSD